MTDEKLKEIAQEKCGKYCGSSCYSHAIEHYKMGYKSRDEEMAKLRKLLSEACGILNAQALGSPEVREAMIKAINESDSAQNT